MFYFLQPVWRSFVPSTRKAVTCRIRLLLLEKIICKTDQKKGGDTEKSTAGKERFAQEHKIKISAWAVRNIPMGSSPLFGIQANICLYMQSENTSKRERGGEKQ